MGIESDQLVFDYLSRVGDLAQQRQLPSGTRMRLVSQLRSEIDRRRARTPLDSPAAVRRILSRLGTPDDVVTAAGASGGLPGTGDAPHHATAPSPAPAPAPAPEPASAPGPEAESGGSRRSMAKGLRRVVPRPRAAEPDTARTAHDIPSPPHLASAQELGDSATRPDWWRVEGGPFGLDDRVPGFVGGVEIPEILKPPPTEEERARQEREAQRVPEDDAVVAEGVVEDAAPARRRRLSLPRLGGWSNPLLLIAAGCLVAGAVLGHPLVLVLGWIIAYGSRRLTPTETKIAVLGLPGAVVAAGVVWLWGRSDGRWGDPLVKGHMNDAVAETWPWVVRGAATASALYLVWRSQRRR
ncbi:hypothetical protein ACFY93_21300 [Streptomyces sp. NPDC008313]|uniref:hypothetical protein n=1 Tax=Streptomyces sp. NPDC008313 TaxID=3364826 RepID=UPI0036DFDDCF